MLIRVISELKRWIRLEGKKNLLPADCFADIKTSKNSLSLWKVDTEILKTAELLNQYIVIAALGKMSLSKVSYLLIEEQELEKSGLSIQQNSPCCNYISENKTDFSSHHFDIVDITHEEYIKIADLIIKKIESDNLNVLSLSEARIAAKELCKNGIVIKDRLQDSMQKAIDK